MLRRFISRVAVISFISLTALGCGYNNKIEKVISAYQSGQFEESAKLAQEMADKAAKDKSQSQVVFRLEEGATLRAAGHWNESNRAFEIAHDTVDKFDYDPDFKVTRETGAALTNLSTLEYRGYAYDGIMLNTYMAMNYLEQGKIDAARIEVNRIYRRQATAVDRFRKRIEKREDEIAKDKKDNAGRAKYDETFDNAGLQSNLKKVYGEDFEPKRKVKYNDLQPYRDYVNPFSEYLRGLFYLHCASDFADMGKALIAMRRVTGMLPPDSLALPYVKEDLGLADGFIRGKRKDPVTYVIFETGLGPKRGQIRIDVPIFLANIAIHDTGVDYVGAAFPTLERRDGHLPNLVVTTTDGRSYKTAILADIDDIVNREFKNELPMVITKTIVATVTKAAIAYALNEATKDNQWANILSRVSTTIYQASQNQADLRTWQTLPKQMQILRLASPKDGKLTLLTPAGSIISTVSVQPGVTNVVYVKSVQAAVAPIVRTYVLQPAWKMTASIAAADHSPTDEELAELEPMLSEPANDPSTQPAPMTRAAPTTAAAK